MTTMPSISSSPPQNSPQKPEDFKPALAEAEELLNAEARARKEKTGSPQHQKSVKALERCLRAFTQKWPGRAYGWLNLGNLLRRQGDLAQALGLIERGVPLAPKEGRGSALSMLCLVLTEMDRFDEANAAGAKAVAAAPKNMTVRRSYAMSLRENGLMEMALRQFTLCGGPLDAWDCCLAYLHLGRYEEGFCYYESRYRLEQFGHSPAAEHLPLWQGEDLAGKTLLLLTEQGFGDHIMISRFYASLAATGARVVVECKKPLWRLFSTLSDVVTLTPSRSLPRADFYLYFMSLPGRLGCRLESIPPPTRFSLLPCAQEKAVRLIPAPSSRQGLHVGLSWTGSKTNYTNRRRSIPLSELAPLFDLPGVTFYSLQKGPGVLELATEGASPARVVNLDSEIEDFADVAAVIPRLDLIITVDTALGHLAGSLAACPVWLLTHWAGYWPYRTKVRKTPWYPGMKLYRQSRPAVWTDMVARLRTDLIALAARTS